MLTSQPNPLPITNTFDNAKFAKAAQRYFDHVYGTRFIHPTKSKLQAYLQTGISPDIYIISPASGQLLSLIACAIEMESELILRFLLEHGADPFMPISPTQTLTPLHLLCAKIKTDFYLSYRNNRFARDMYQVLYAFASNAQPQFCQGLENDIRSTFFVLYHRLRKEMSEAKRLGKPLLIMMAETHASSIELVLNAMIIQICAQLDISNLMIEQSQMYHKNLIEASRELQPGEDPYLIDYVWSPAIGNHIYGYRNGMKLIPIDTQRERNDVAWNTTPEGAFHRENAMIEQMLHHGKEPGFCTIGLAHLERLVHHEHITRTFHVFPINAAFTFQDNPQFAYAYSSGVLQISDLFDLEFIEKIDTMLAPLNALNLVMDVGRKFKLDDEIDANFNSTPGTGAKKCTIC